MTRAIVLLAFGSWLAMAQTPAPADWRFAHPNADMRIGVNMQALLNSPAITKAIEAGKEKAKGAAGAGTGGNNAQIDMALAMLRTIDRVSVSAVQLRSAGAVPSKNAGIGASGTPAGDMDVLVEVSGSFDPAIITGFFPSTGASKVKAVGPHAILIGEGDSFTKAIARLDASAPPVVVDGMASDDIWIEASGDFIAKQANSQQQTPFLKDIRGFGMGIMLTESPVIDLAMTAADADAAKTLLGTMNLMMAMAGGSPQMAAFSKNVSLTQEDAKVKMHMTIPPEVVAMLQQQMQQAATSPNAPGGSNPLAALAPFLGNFGLGGAAGSKPAGPAAAPAAPPNDGKVVIYGLDGGPKEISPQK